MIKHLALYKQQLKLFHSNWEPEPEILKDISLKKEIEFLKKIMEKLNKMIEDKDVEIATQKI